MGPFFASRFVVPASTFVVPALMLASFVFSACDSSSDSDEIRVAVIIEGNGSGRVESRNPPSLISCIVEDGEVRGDCEGVFIAPGGRGTLRLVAVPSIATNFTWGFPCQAIDSAVCEIEFDAGILSDIEIRTFFEAKTQRIVMTPSTASITAPGDDGAIFVAAQALDENGVEVLGVVLVWEVDSPGIVDVVPQSDPRRVLVRALTEGVVIISATAQGVVGTTGIEIEYSD